MSRSRLVFALSITLLLSAWGGFASAATLGSPTASTTLGSGFYTQGKNILDTLIVPGSIAGPSMSAGYISTGIFGFNSTQGYYSFKNGSTDIMYIDSANARVGIGTTAPYSTLTVGSTDATAFITPGGSNTHLSLVCYN